MTFSWTDRDTCPSLMLLLAQSVVEMGNFTLFSFMYAQELEYRRVEALQYFNALKCANIFLFFVVVELPAYPASVYENLNGSH